MPAVKSKIICGDSRFALNDIKDKSVQCVVTSPPYWGLRDYGHPSQIGQEPSLTDYLSQISIVFDHIFRVLKEDGVFWLNVGDSFTSGNRTYRAGDKKNKNRNTRYRPLTPTGLKEKDLIGIPWKIAFTLQEKGWYLRNDIIWHKPNAMPESVKDRPYRNHEYLFMLTKNPKYYFDNECLVQNSRVLRSVWSIKNEKSSSTIHSATFPKELIQYCVKSSSRPDDLVLDPFCGIGTVGTVCDHIGRKFIGIEINQSFATVAKKQLD